MTRTSPPRRTPVEAVVRDRARPATRLHPRPGTPGVTDSSVGGPLLWPAGEPWPVCAGGSHDATTLHRLADVRRWRAILGAAWARTPVGAPLAISEDERARLPDLDGSLPPRLPGGPVPMIAVAQLYRRDVPGLGGPAGADVLQVLWCPLDHDDLEYCPRVHLRWRDSTQVTEVLAAPPEPVVVNGDYLPQPCGLDPEVIVEYPYTGLGTAGLHIADGWKIGGYADWSLSDPRPMDCERCGTPMELLVCAASSEWDHETFAWRPVEDAVAPASSSLFPVSGPTGVVIGRGYSLWVFTCPVSGDHPHRTAMQ